MREISLDSTRRAGAFMMTFLATRRYVISWWIVALATVCQTPYLYGDPLCPTCGDKAAAASNFYGPPSPTMAQHGQEDVNILPAPHVAQQQPYDSPPVVPPPHFGPPRTAQPPVEQPVIHQGVVEIESEVPVPVVKLKIRVPACAEVGKEVEYRIKVENSSPADAHNVTVRMNLPASVRILRASPQIHQREPELQWNLGTLPGHGCHDIVVMIVPIGLADIKSCTRVTFEHGQCVTTKVVQYAPQGSADGRGGFPGDPNGPGGGFGGGPGGAGGSGGRSDFDVRIFAPTEAAIGAPVTYKVTMFNKSDRPVYKAGVSIEWGNDLEEARLHDELINIPGIAGRFWPRGLFDVLPPNSSKSIDIVLRSRGPGRFCVKASASASVSQDQNDNRSVNAKDEACTEFRRGIPGMTLEMFDRDDPILKDGKTSYPITVRNQGKDPITNLQVKARVPDMMALDQVRGPGRYRSGLDAKREFWVEFEPLPTLSVGETQTFEIFVKAKGQTGDARFEVQMTADQLDRGPGGAARWIIEQESTIVVPDEETRIRVREISLKAKRKTVPGTVTSK